jgi:hypothetical protein
LAKEEVLNGGIAMVTMNKPAQNDTNWYQPVTDNWTAIETSLIDKSIVSAKGDLLVATAASTLARLGGGTDGQVLTADSAQTTGVKWASGTGIPNTSYLNDIVYDKRFFSKAGLLPGTQYYETAADTAPTVDWDNTGVTSVTAGSSRRWLSVGSTQLIGWDLGANRQRVLMIFSQYLDGAGDRLIFMTTSKPATGDVTGNGYAGGLNSYGNRGLVYKVAAGGFNILSATNYAPYTTIPYGVAMLFDNGNVRYFYRFGNFQWIEGTFVNDGTYTTVRYPGVRLLSGGTLCLGPVSIYYDT